MPLPEFSSSGHSARSKGRNSHWIGGEFKHNDAMTLIRERMEKRNEERVDALGSVLTDRQLEAYRSHLENSKGFFQNSVRVEEKRVEKGPRGENP